MNCEFDVFISYKTENEDFAKKIAKDIEATDFQGRKLRVFLYQWDIKPGENIVSKIELGLEKARYILLILTPEYFQSDWTMAEKSAAIFSDPSGRLGRVLLLMHKKCQLPPLLAFRNYIDFTKKQDYQNSFQRLISVVTGNVMRKRGATEKENSGLPEIKQSDPHGPDYLQEDIFSNLFPLTKMPQFIWSAPTRFRRFNDLREYYEDIIPVHLLHDKRLFTFFNLEKEENPFTGIIEEYDIKKEKVSDWLKKSETSKLLVWLLNDCLRFIASKLKLSFDDSGKKYYYKLGTLKDTSFKAFSKGKGRNMILPYPGYFAHRAIKLRFMILGDEIVLSFDPGWIFSYDGYKKILGRRRSVLNTRFLSAQRNISNYNEIRYWFWFFSSGGGKIIFDFDEGGIEIEPNTIHCLSQRGIFGDKITPSKITEPPELKFDLDSDFLEDFDLESTEDLEENE